MAWRGVLDTSVLVAALRSRRGASFGLLELLRAGAFEIAISVPLAVEYEAVLTRHAANLGLRRTEAAILVDYLCSVSIQQRVHFLWRPTLRDANDDFVLELVHRPESYLWYLTVMWRTLQRAAANFSSPSAQRNRGETAG